jgi:uncharacterized membrane protein
MATHNVRSPAHRIIAALARVLLGAALVFAGFSHLTTARVEFLAQVPQWVPLDPDLVVVLSGIVEIILGGALIFLWPFQRQVGLVVALFFIAIFPGNISQFVTQTDAFGLSSDLARGIRLLFQPLLVVWALWCTQALALFPRRKGGGGRTS